MEAIGGILRRVFVEMADRIGVRTRDFTGAKLALGSGKSSEEKRGAAAEATAPVKGRKRPDADNAPRHGDGRPNGEPATQEDLFTRAATPRR